MTQVLKTGKTELMGNVVMNIAALACSGVWIVFASWIDYDLIFLIQNSVGFGVNVLAMIVRLFGIVKRRSNRGNGSAGNGNIGNGQGQGNGSRGSGGHEQMGNGGNGSGKITRLNTLIAAEMGSPGNVRSPKRGIV